LCSLIRVAYSVRRPCSDFTDMLWRLTNCRIIIIIIIIKHTTTCSGFSIGGPRPKCRRPRSWVVFLGGGSNPISTSSLGALWVPTTGLRREPRPPGGFPLFSALRIPSPDTTILLTVDYHAAIMQDRRGPVCKRPW